jgi:NTP pyrophosphatase (non-canonical NTP hydrolase)
MRTTEDSLNEILGFDELRRANVDRCDVAFHKCEDWSLTDWATALGGETGEAQNLIKKIRRGDKTTFVKGKLVPLTNHLVGMELADVIIYADLLAQRLGLNLGALVRMKFNLVSEEKKCKHRL